ncbi:MAG: peptidase M23 [Desulfobacterales bacterium RIFOXYA12_FULL_46_15]|nr:MAG: peptidase M23 [Desulfobacterales bacterium RIFOXYA12_FULL_46_15]
MKRSLVLILALLSAGFSIYILLYLFEGTAPAVDTALPSGYLKKGYEMSMNVSDMKTGLQQIIVTVMQQGKEITLLDKQYEPPGFFGIFFGPKTMADSFMVPIEISKYGITDGEVIIRITGTDNSLRGWGRGNTSHIENKLIYDSKPPELAVLSDQHNIERGGTGFIIYKTSEDTIKSGVEVENNFFPGHSGLFENRNIHSCFFALTYLQGPGTKLSLIAEDMSGNIAKKNFNHYIRDKKYPTDTLEISDSFLEKKLPDFESGIKEESFEGQDNPLLKKFLYINEDLRKENEDQILKITSNSETIKHWEGSFSRLARSERKAGFADHRIYQYKGSEVDRAVHLGIDLASTAHSPVYPANEGKVILAELIGIFGNTVIIDHGFGLCSLYSHLDRIQVKPGDGVKKETQIGITGLTGMAAGDHLHFSMMVHNVFVNPIEWWDDSWINNNISSKIKAVKQRSDI